MTHPKQAPPGDDAELAARIEAATRPAPWTPLDQARFRASVVARVAAQEPARRAWRWGLAASLASGIAAAALWTARTERHAEVASPATVVRGDSESLEDSFEEQLLFAPEWIERDAGFVDDEILPESYALASALLDS